MICGGKESRRIRWWHTLEVINWRTVSFTTPFFLYLFIFTLGSILLTALGVDFLTSISAVASAVGNVGPGIAQVGPSYSFDHIPLLGKWLSLIHI